MRTLFYICFICVITTSIVLFTGCEVESTNDKVRISPDSVTIKPGQSILFTASGGTEYKWSIQTDSIGILSTRSGNQTVYTAATDASNNTQILYVEATLPWEPAGGTTSSTNSSTSTETETRTAEASIRHAASGSPSSSASTNALSVSPIATTLDVSAANTLALTASGGTPPYTWSVNDGSLGSISSKSADLAVYTATTNTGQNIVLLGDNAGTTVSATVKQE